MQTQEESTFSIAFIKYISREKNAKLFVVALIKRETLTSRKVLNTKSYTRNQFLFCKKFQNTDFSLLKCQLKRKRNCHSLFVKILQVWADEGMGKKSKLVEFWTQKRFQILARVISERKAKHLDDTTMFTFCHANTPLDQSERAFYRSYFMISCFSYIHRGHVAQEVTYNSDNPIMHGFLWIKFVLSCATPPNC